MLTKIGFHSLVVYDTTLTSCGDCEFEIREPDACNAMDDLCISIVLTYKFFPGRNQHQERGVQCQYQSDLSCSVALTAGLQCHLATFSIKEKVVGS
jgi:hypothetical protein